MGLPHHAWHTRFPAHALPKSAYPALIISSSTVLLYLLLEKQLLPESWWRPLQRLYFYPMMLPNLLLRVASCRPYFSRVDDHVMFGAVPMVIAGHVGALHHEGVRAVVNLQAEYEGPVAAYQALCPPIEQLRIPVTDHVELTVEQLQQAVDFIALHRRRGERVLVHCKGGHGRSAAVAMAWLISKPGGSLTPEAAQHSLSLVRDVRKSLYRQPAIVQFFRDAAC